jgi:PAS domain S-box-containing protein
MSHWHWQGYIEEHTRRLMWWVVMVWTILVGASWLWNLHQVQKFALELARNEANLSYEKDLAYRLWAAKHGGVYVPVTPQSPPNAYLSHITERDIQTSTGRVLTLVNPAYMTRQVHELSAQLYGSRGHLTSLKPLRPENAPDAWETKALEAFEAGVTEIIQEVRLAGHPYMRLMRPWRAEQACLKCHVGQGYQVGDIRGGISVAVPLQPYLTGIRTQRRHLGLGHGLIWLLGAAGIIMGGGRIKKHLQERRQAEAELAETLRQKEEALAKLEHLASFPRLNPNPVLEIDLQGDITYANQAALDSLKQLATEARLEDFLPEDWEEIRRATGEKGKKVFQRKVEINNTVFNETIAFAEPFGVWRIYANDITKRKQAEEALRESQRQAAFLADLLESSSQPFGVGYPDGRLGTCNAAYAHLLGYSKEEFMTLDWSRDLTPPEWLKIEQAKLAELNQTDQPVRYEKEYWHKNGSRVPVEILANVRRDDRGQPIYYYAFITDISERQRAEAKLRESEAKFRNLFENMAEGVVLHEMISDPDGRAVDYRILAANPAFEKHTGLKVADIAGRQASQAFAAGEAPYLEIYAAVAQTGQPDAFETFFPPLQRYFHVSATSPKQGHFVTVFEDITARRNMEEALHRSNQQLDLLAGSAGQLLASGAPQKVVDVICPKVMEFLDCDVFFNFLLDENAGRLHLNAYAGIPAAEARLIEWLDYGVAVCGCAAQDGCRIVAEDIQTTLDTRTDLVKSFGVQAYACHPLMIQGRLLGTLSFGTRSRTKFTVDELALMKAVADQVAIAIERKLAEEKLREHSTQLSRVVADLEKKTAELERFIYMISHDLKSPLVTISTFLGYLGKDMKSGDTGRVAKDMQYMQRAADKMGQLLSELLEMSRIGRMVNPPVEVTFQELVEEALDVVAGPLAGRGMEVKVSEAEVALYGDRPRLVEIWQNLMENAVKFMGEQPSPRLEAGVEQQDGSLVFFVCDNGLGIDPRYHKKIFGMFEKLDTSSEGTGIGLALAKRIVELYQGKLWVESSGSGQGSCFRFTLPGAVKSEEF